MALADLIGVVLDAYLVILLVRVIVSWVGFDPRHAAARILIEVTEPVLAPIRNLLPASGGLDFSPMVAMLIVSLLKRVVMGF